MTCYIISFLFALQDASRSSSAPSFSTKTRIHRRSQPLLLAMRFGRELKAIREGAFTRLVNSSTDICSEMKLTDYRPFNVLQIAFERGIGDRSIHRNVVRCVVFGLSMVPSKVYYFLRHRWGGLCMLKVIFEAIWWQDFRVGQSCLCLN